MIVACISCKEKHRPKIRGILSRYMWRIDSDVFIWKNSSVYYDISKELEKLKDKSYFSVSFYTKSGETERGFRVRKIGKYSMKMMDSDLYMSIKTIC